MKKRTLLLILSSVFVFAGFISAYAQEEDEKKVDEVSARVDAESRDPAEAMRVEQRLEKRFNVTDARIDSLREQGLGYGEISTTLSLASRMPGGINDENVGKIMDLRQGEGGHKEGWGNIARDLGLKLHPAAQDMNDIRQDRTQGSSNSRAGAAAGRHK
ncbi:MAG TPA: hypothetical protein VI955_02605 [Candidatus Omnitrophota bacterium]|nr:hypothetical protein [Candidatus Omnitrophota bacterium]